MIFAKFLTFLWGKRKNPLPEVIKIWFFVLGIIFCVSNQGVGASLMPNLLHYGFSLQILKHGGLSKFWHFWLEQELRRGNLRLCICVSICVSICVCTLCNRALRMALKEFLQHSKESRGLKRELKRELKKELKKELKRKLKRRESSQKKLIERGHRERTQRKLKEST